MDWIFEKLVQSNPLIIPLVIYVILMFPVLLGGLFIFVMSILIIPSTLILSILPEKILNNILNQGRVTIGDFTFLAGRYIGRIPRMFDFGFFIIKQSTIEKLQRKALMGYTNQIDSYINFAFGQTNYNSVTSDNEDDIEFPKFPFNIIVRMIMVVVNLIFSCGIFCAFLPLCYPLIPLVLLFVI